MTEGTTASILAHLRQLDPDNPARQDLGRLRRLLDRLNYGRLTKSPREAFHLHVLDHGPGIAAAYYRSLHGGRTSVAKEHLQREAGA